MVSETTTQDDKYVLFEVEGTIYGVLTTSVHHIEMVEHVTLVPDANPAIDGVVFSRGQVIPALNLRTRFGFPRQAPTLRTRIVFVQVRDRVVGLIVDTAREFLRIDADKIQPIETTLTGIQGNYLKSVANLDQRLVLLLDLEQVLDVENYEPALEPGAQKVSANP